VLHEWFFVSISIVPSFPMGELFPLWVNFAAMGELNPQGWTLSTVEKNEGQTEGIHPYIG
jgi:hypothetical protein